MYQIIAEKISLVFTDEKTYTDETDKIFERVADNFRQRIKSLDAFAFSDGDTPSFWRMVYHMMLEADLAFTLSNVSLIDYMKTGRFGRTEEN